MKLTATLLCILLSASASYAYVLSTADTLGVDKVGIAGIYSVNQIKTAVPGIVTTDLSSYSTGFVFQYGIFKDLDLMLGIGNISYSITPDVAGALQMNGGTLIGLGAKYNLVDEGKQMPVSLALLFQHTAVPATLIDTGIKNEGMDHDTYYKLIISKKINAFLPYIALGVDNRILRIGQMRSQVSMAQVDVGYGTAVSDHIFVGVEVNWSGRWLDRVMDEILAADTRSEAIGYSFGVEYIY